MNLLYESLILACTSEKSSLFIRYDRIHFRFDTFNADDLTCVMAILGPLPKNVEGEKGPGIR